MMGLETLIFIFLFVIVVAIAVGVAKARRNMANRVKPPLENTAADTDEAARSSSSPRRRSSPVSRPR